MISYIRYHDAIYVYVEDEVTVDSTFKLYTYSAIGILTQEEAHSTIVFSELKDGTPARGLIVPNGALITEKSRENQEHALPAGTQIEVYWDDIVYFDDGNVPTEATQMYTDGEYAFETDELVAVVSPVTIKLNKGNSPHPNDITKPVALIVIPKSLITHIKSYGG